MRAFVASQANHAGFGGWNHQIRPINHLRIGRLEVLYYSSLFTLTQSLILNLRNFVANLPLSRLHTLWETLLAEILRRGDKNILVDWGPPPSRITLYMDSPLPMSSSSSSPSSRQKFVRRCSVPGEMPDHPTTSCPQPLPQPGDAWDEEQEELEEEENEEEEEDIKE